MCARTQFSSLPQTHNILVTARKLFEICFDFCISNENGDMWFKTLQLISVECLKNIWRIFYG
jgi:hypothetical protein